jgi:hypothetical protein
LERRDVGVEIALHVGSQSFSVATRDRPRG